MRLYIGSRLHKLEDAVLDHETKVLSCRRCANSEALLEIKGETMCRAVLMPGLQPMRLRIKEVSANEVRGTVEITLQRP